MSTRYLIVGTVPADSRATTLAGRIYRLPAHTPADVARRVTEAYRAGSRPAVQVTR